MKWNTSSAKAFFEKGISIHLYFLTGLLVLMIVIALQSNKFIELLPRVLLVYVLIICCTYSGRWLAQQFVMKNKWVLLILFGSLGVLLFSAVGVFAMVYLTNYSLEQDISSFVVITPLLVILTMLGGGFVTTTRMVFQQRITEANYLQQRAEAELQLLISRLSPHFLFNTLNNLYGLALTEHTRVPQLLLQLSDLLSYSIYSSDEPTVRLKDELDYIHNFIALESIRMSDRLILNTDIVTTGYEDVEIPPMVLIVFVENAFKHSKNSLDKAIQIDLKIGVEGDSVYLRISNSISKEHKDNTADKNSGLGIATTIRRLDLLYGKNYTLDYGHQENKYIVELKMKSYAKS